MRQGVRHASRLEGVVVPPGDKSISHRAALLNTIADGSAHVSNFCVGDDRSAMLQCLRGLGGQLRRHESCSVSGADECFEVTGLGIDGLQEPGDVLDAGNSGTTMRLVSGLLASQPFFSVISGDGSLRNRPMARILNPLRMMGATVSGRQNGSLAPLVFQGGELTGIEYEMPVASAQLKSSILIAGLAAAGATTAVQPSASRDHTERMMAAMGANISVNELRVTVQASRLKSMDVNIPCDTSGASFWLVAACAHPNASIRVNGVGINPTRTGVLTVLERMGANIRIENVREDAGEPSADLIAETSDLRGVEISGDIIPAVIDELPVLALAASVASGDTVIRDAAELRVKESDRIKATVEGLNRLGARVEETDDGMTIHGGSALSGAEVRSRGDHRIAMTMAVAGLVATGETAIEQAEAADVSYPGFWETLAALQ
ncbi:MAG: 3-phosphoshikimate 1-carboxyvinyltransferase [SAR202 cluster bacterium]|mgnify:CR=1 FL=1|jgi:3-phosphoshikimate 1-carboxyvinyltransferase|nr:3-phosphoshikimate 1-carboxyvinyltransferase [Chloroflexota bacterium]MDP6420070.1 3-phosphoshikimate 1-carboxyvinyltransferase [SAR202 cluster bacterium]HAL47566.1 3-phosphoshikimate 1-carboxyvinyltransferase [Dehalococcoidia bacterium]MDP6664427.1 3-phosphoshikimate 1-carboxyvinyltransferase [SAR202 cluster bacterium]MDP6799995.1 3-phosphoshikimate 1-carboxyvinyltransferase [SAR202 cluster bacterium]|tara:strand:+ start:1862 stop:3163 length:1302 start_codon:yes stop_codon:yes gene_type:complete